MHMNKSSTCERMNRRGLISRNVSSYFRLDLPISRHTPNDSKRTGRKRSFWRPPRSPLVSFLAFVILFLVLIFVWHAWRRYRRNKKSWQANSMFPTSPQQQNFTSATPLDFIVAGFPKCGTTSLLFALQPHPDISMSPQENCQIARPIQADDINIKQLERDVVKLHSAATANLATLPPRKLVGLKCPDALKNMRAIHRLSLHSPNCRFVVGVRHPLLMFQSFYNYRITAMYDKGIERTQVIPSLETVVDSPVPWQDVSLDMVRFELFLVQFAKTQISLEHLEMLQGKNWLGIKPNKFRIFLYVIDQLEDEDDGRQTLFRQELESFLGLTQPLPAFPHENVNRFIGKEAHPETIDICQSKYSDIRRRILENAKATKSYLRSFVESQDVVVGNPRHFLSLIESWDQDPCSNATVPG